jgi:hypothetical protein
MDDFVDPPPTASGEEKLREWNALAAEFDRLWTRCWNGERRSRTTLQTVRGAATQACLHQLKMLNTLRRHDPADAPLRALEWQVSRVRLALDHDAVQRGPRIEANPRTPCGFQISESIRSAAGKLFFHNFGFIEDCWH